MPEIWTNKMCVCCAVLKVTNTVKVTRAALFLPWNLEVTV